MKKLRLTLLICILGGMQCLESAETKSLKGRFNTVKENVVKKMSALFVLWSDDTYEAQKKRLDVYDWFKQKDWWMRHPKKWMKWIVTGSMPVKYPDNRVTDDEYVNYYQKYKELCLNRSLTDEEKDEFCAEAMALLNEYRHAKGIQ